MTGFSSLRRFTGMIGLLVTIGACSAERPLGPEALRATKALVNDEATALTASESSAERYEIKFLQGMIDHHHMAVMMAEMCADKATHQELLALCEEMATTQSAEIEQMHAWLEAWYGITYHPDIMPTKLMEKLEALEGADFEIAFLRMMIKHHTKAVKEGTKCADRAIHGELVEFCEEMAAMQADEIAMMKDWLCDWYGICKGKDE